MSEKSEKIAELAKYRFEKAQVALKAAKLMIDTEDYAFANNRSYYAIFHALRAVLALDEFDSKKHGMIIGEFRRRYIKTGLFNTEISDMIGQAFEIRNDSDYEDMYIASKSDAVEQVKNAEFVIGKVEQYLKGKNIL